MSSGPFGDRLHVLRNCYVIVNQARVKNADLRHPSCTVVMYRRKSASTVLNVLTCMNQSPRMNRALCIYQISKCTDAKPEYTSPTSEIVKCTLLTEKWSEMQKCKI